MIAMLLVDPDAGTFVGSMLTPAGDTADGLTPELADHLHAALLYQAERPCAGAIFVHVPED